MYTGGIVHVYTVYEDTCKVYDYKCTYTGVHVHVHCTCILSTYMYIHVHNVHEYTVHAFIKWHKHFGAETSIIIIYQGHIKNVIMLNVTETSDSG